MDIALQGNHFFNERDIDLAYTAAMAHRIIFLEAIQHDLSTSPH
jgi:hypothetical protein